jgi:hypothetical protein
MLRSEHRADNFRLAQEIDAATHIAIMSNSLNGSKETSKCAEGDSQKELPLQQQSSSNTVEIGAAQHPDICTTG